LGFTVTVEVAVLEQAPILPVTVYVIVVVGLAVTLLPVVPLRPVAGDQVYVVAPVAVRTVELPLHKEGELTDTTGVVLGGIVTVPIPVRHPVASRTVTV
jgi:hypothetical protein